MRKSMLTGEIPQGWRDANIVPIYKKINGNRGHDGISGSARWAGRVELKKR